MVVTAQEDRIESWRIPWPNVLLALVLSVVATVALGGALFALEPNVWGVAVASVVSLLIGGVLLGLTSREPEPLYGTLLAILYFGLVAALLFGGTLADALPEPLPGLGKGDSTFFFVWPLLQLAAGVAGSALGGRLVRPKR
ncbi:MAG: hypothetical protein HY331_16225 [Chloroflexi bacterium]|nr:hypothetical protein [Chloroflexota bacterium]